MRLPPDSGRPRRWPAARGRGGILRGRVALAAALVLALVGCGGGSAGTPVRADAARAAGTPVAFETALVGAASAITSRETVVVRDAAQWAALWQRHAALMLPPPAAPIHDFTGRQIVGVFLGNRPDGCRSVAITAIEQQVQSVLVTYREQDAAAGTACVQELTQPHHLVWMPASTLPVEFRAE